MKKKTKKKKIVVSKKKKKKIVNKVVSKKPVKRRKNNKVKVNPVDTILSIEADFPDIDVEELAKIQPTGPMNELIEANINKNEEENVPRDKILDAIMSRVIDKKMTFMASVLEVADLYNVSPEFIAPLLSDPIKERIRQEAIEMNLLPPPDPSSQIPGV